MKLILETPTDEQKIVVSLEKCGEDINVVLTNPTLNRQQTIAQVTSKGTLRLPTIGKLEAELLGIKVTFYDKIQLEVE